MSNKGFNMKQITGYTAVDGFLKGRAIPLHRWDAKDDQGRDRGKTPRDGRWTTAEYSMAGDIMPHIQGGNNMGVRLLESDLVLDFDPRNMEMSCEAAIDALELSFGLPLTDAPTVVTGSGGLHIYLEIPPQFRGIKFRNEIPEFKGVEFKSVGRQVVAAGSVHPSGGEYRWAEGKLGLAKRPPITPEFVQAVRRGQVDSVATAEQDAISGDQLSALLDQLDVTEFASNDEWVTVMMACHDATAGSEEGMIAFSEWSAGDPQYGAQSAEIMTRWTSLQTGTQGGVTIGTLLKKVREAGGSTSEILPEENAFGDISDEVGIDAMFEVTKDGKAKATVRNTMLAVDAMGLVPRMNSLSDRVELDGDLDEIRKHFPAISEVWDDDSLHALKAAIIFAYGFEAPLQMVREAVRSKALSNSYNPVVDYLESLEWDGTPRMNTWLTTYAGVSPSDYTTYVSSVTLLAGVARAYVPGVKFDTMPILEGTQGCGKSTLVKILGGDYTLEGLPSKDDLNSKDVIQAIQGFWMVEVEELNAVRKGDSSSIKAFLSRQEDRARFAYATEAKNYPRRCVFIGTTNDSEYLADTTGNRRFLPVSVGRVDLEGLQAVRDQLWAEAVASWKADADPSRLQTPMDLYENAAVEQNTRRVIDPIEEEASTYLNGGERDTVRINELMAAVYKKSAGECSPEQRTRVMEALRSVEGWQAGNCKDVHGRPNTVAHRTGTVASLKGQEDNFDG